MADKTITQLFADNPQTGYAIIGPDPVVEIEADFGEGLVSGAIKFSELVKAVRRSMAPIGICFDYVSGIGAMNLGKFTASGGSPADSTTISISNGEFGNISFVDLVGKRLVIHDEDGHVSIGFVISVNATDGYTTLNIDQVISGGAPGFIGEGSGTSWVSGGRYYFQEFGGLQGFSCTPTALITFEMVNGQVLNAS